MAFRSSAITSSTTGGTLTATPAGVVAHDYLGMFFVRDDTTAITIGYPTGWTEQVNADQALPDKQTVRYADKPDASGSDSFALVTGAVNHCSLIEAAWSGRDNSTPRSTAPVKTNNTTANASAISATITGITATLNDDIAVWMFTDQTLQASRWTFSTITNYTEQRDGVAVDWVSGIALDTRDAVSAGGTGNFSTTITDASSSTAGYGGIVVAIKAAATVSANVPQLPRARTIKTDRTLIIEGGRQRSFAPRRAMSGTRIQEAFSAATVANSALSAAGDSTATFVGAAQDNSVLAAAGDATATFTGASKAAAVLSAAADATATFTGASKAASVLSAAGDSSASFTGAAQAKSTLSAPGDATASFTGAALDRGVLNAPGDSSLSFVGRADAAAVWNAAGDASAAWIGSTGGNVLSGDGDSSAIFVGAELAAAVLAAAGDSSALWSGAFTVPGGDELGVRAPMRGRAKARKPPKQRRPIYRHPEEVERERRMLEEYLESLETKARPASEEPVRPGESQEAPTRRAEPVAPRLSDVMARLASAQQLELIARAERVAEEDRAKAQKEHKRRRAAATAVLMMSH